MKIAEMVSEARALLGEGPLWSAESGLLYWVDIFGQRLHRLDPSSGEDSSVATGLNVACLAFAGENGMIAGTTMGFQLLNPADGKLEALVDPESTEPENRFNDGKVDFSGRFIAGTMSTAGRPNRGSLYCLDRQMRVIRLLDGLSISNGLDWSPDGATLYLIDSAVKCVFAFDYIEEGPRLENRRVVIDATEETDTRLLDGMAIDREGMLWICHFGAGMIVRWDPLRGRKLETVSVPAPKVTSCAFGGPDMRRLFITSARTGLDDATLSEWPHSGGVFAIDCAVGGYSSRVFGSESAEPTQTRASQTR